MCNCNQRLCHTFSFSGFHLLGIVIPDSFLENWMTFSAERCKIRLIVKSRGDKKSCNSPHSYFVYMARLKNQTRTLDFLTIVNKERTCFHLYIDASPISHFQTTLRNSHSGPSEVLFYDKCEKTFIIKRWTMRKS